MTEVAKPTAKEYFYCALLALPWLAVQGIWATVFGVVTNMMIEFGLPKESANWIWIFGPLTGFFTAPLVGAYSDAYTGKWGRRRPFIITGLLLTVIFSMLFAFCYNFGDAKIFIGYVSFIGLDITINVMQTPIRALGSDLAPPSLQNEVQLMASFFQGVGAVVGYILQNALYDTKKETLPQLFGAVMGLNLIVITGVISFVKETQYVPPEGAEKISIMKPFTTIFKNVFSMSRRMVIVCAIEFCSWWALFFWWTNAAVWWQTTVYQGCAVVEGDNSCPKDSVGNKAYKEGNKAYTSTGIYANLIQIVFSLGLAVIMGAGFLKRVKFAYAFGLAFGAVLLILLKFGFTTIPFAWIVTLALPVAISVIQAFPFALVGAYNKKHDGQETGVQMGLLNLFICAPQIAVTLISNGLKMSATDGLFISGIALGLGALLCLFIEEADDAAAKDIEDGKKN